METIGGDEKKKNLNLKSKVISLLETKSHSYKDLADHLNLTEEQLDLALETRTLEVRTLELISKELRIPLYSFFRDPEHMALEMTKIQEPYYNVNIWSDQEMKYKNEISFLYDEINKLKLEISKKDLIIEALENQLKNN